MLTPKDIENVARASGYDHVGLASSARSPAKNPFQAMVYTGPGQRNGRMGLRWRGPRRATALESAMDYCNYVNGAGVMAVPALKSAGHKGKRDGLAMNDEVQEALGILRDARAARSGKQGYVYLIVESPLRLNQRFGKIGFSTNPAARVAELQTGNPRPLMLLAEKPGTEADEAALHAKYQRFNVLQEWFWVSDALLDEFSVPSVAVAKVAA